MTDVSTSSDPSAVVAAESAGRRHRTLRFGPGPEWSFAQVGAAVAAAAGVLVYLGAFDRAVGGLPGIWWFLVLVPLVTARWSGSAGPLALWVLLLVLWFWQAPEGTFTWWSLPAAAGVITGHAAPALSAGSPAAASFPAATLRRWVRHGLVALAAAGATAVTVAALLGRVGGVGAGAVALVVGLFGLAAALVWLRTSPPLAPE
ncbi:MAG: hypothetical protein JWP82_1412 [Humibacillus sp.]|nr:hypothetical protein [Humibacillus sp.]